MNDLVMVFDQVANMIFSKGVLIWVFNISFVLVMPKIIFNTVKALCRPPRRIVREIYSDAPAACKDFMPERCMVCAELSDGRCMAHDCPEWQNTDCMHCARYSACEKRREGEK